MSKRGLRGLAALLEALLLTALLPPALTEASEVSEGVSEAMDLTAVPVLYCDVEPEVGLALDAGDTGLTVEFEEDGTDGLPPVAAEDGLAPDATAEESDTDATAEESDAPDATAEDGLAPGATMEENGLTLEDEDAAEPDGQEPAELLAVPQVGVGYAAIALQAVVYADSDMARAIGAFPEGAMVYVEAVEREGALLKIRFDTEDARDWAQPIPEGWVFAEEALCCDAGEAAALEQSLAADPRARQMDGVAIPCAEFEAWDCAVMAGESATGLGVAARSQAEIQAFVDAHPSYRNQTNLYSVAASDNPYQIGRLSAVNQRSALNMIGQMRYIAGLDADVGLLTEQEDNMAAASLVLRLNGALSHSPVRPAALAGSAYDKLYEDGKTGAGHANIAMGYTATSSILAYMADSDQNNIATVGHRRWIINPKMSKTVFGANGRFSAMYAHDVSGSGGQTKVAWPAQQMPLQYFSATDPWSVSFGRKLDASQVRVDLVRVRDGATWRFSQDASDGYFNVENSYYGLPGCVIFRPNTLDGIAEGDTFNVSVTDGANAEITRYTVRFFNLDLSAADPFDALDVSALKTAAGNAISWSAMAGATGYYVCRRTETGNYQIVADISGTDYMDVNVFDDLTYYYQVYAHNASVTSRSAISVKVRVPPDSVSLGGVKTLTVYSNATLQLTASLSPGNASATLSWSSSKPNYATVDANGLVKPVKKGTTVISVRTDNGKQASVKVKVVAPPKPKKVVLSAKGTVVLNVGETLQLSATVQPAAAVSTVKWSSSKKKAATVSGGLVKAVGEGTATITAKTVNGKKAKVKVKVVDPSKPTGVTLDRKGTVTLKVGQTLQLNATVAPATAQTTLKWSSSKKKLASVNGSGLVTALKKGTTVVTVRTANGKTAKVKIKVVK